MDHECFCVCERMCVREFVRVSVCSYRKSLQGVFSLTSSCSSWSGLLCQCRILVTVSCFSGEEDYFMTVPIWRGRNKDGYIGQIVSCSMKCVPLPLTFYHLLLGAHWDQQCFFFSSHSFLFYQILNEMIENMFPWHGHTGRLIPLRTLPKELSLISNIARGH